jgi:hypothetical protein
MLSPFIITSSFSVFSLRDYFWLLPEKGHLWGAVIAPALLVTKRERFLSFPAEAAFAALK